MNAKRILYYVRLVFTIISCMTPITLLIWWFFHNYGHLINWEPLLEIFMWIGIAIVTIAGLFVGIMGIQSLYKEIQADLLDRELKKEGRTLCRRCNGRGCRNCDQQGYLDWVSRVTGVKDKFNSTVTTPGASQSNQGAI